MTKNTTPIVLVRERVGYKNNLDYPERCEILQYFGNGCFEVRGLRSGAIEKIYDDEIIYRFYDRGLIYDKL